MKLQEFISETLKEIIAGVEESQKYAASHNSGVNPGMKMVGDKKEVRYIAHEYSVYIEKIEFDVAVTSTEGSETKAGIGIMVAGIGLGAKGKSDTSSSSISRIKFSIPIALPRQLQQTGST